MNKVLWVFITIAGIIALFLIGLMIYAFVAPKPEEPAPVPNVIKVYDIEENCKEYRYFDGDKVDDEVLYYYENRSISFGGRISSEGIVTFDLKVFEIHLYTLKFSDEK